MTNPLTLVTLLVLTQAGSGAAPKEQAPASADSFQPDPAWKPLGTDLWFDAKARRVVLRARICQTEATLEHLVCLKGTKEHESILATEAPAKLIHAGLLLTGATPGHPVQFEPQFAPPTGTEVAIEVEWTAAGKSRKVDAREWVKEEKSGATLKRDWVFAGSVLFEDRRTKKMVYAAEDGDLITVANFATSILDLPYRSSASDADRTYMAHTDRIPPKGTLVTIYLSPRPPAPAPPGPQKP